MGRNRDVGLETTYPNKGVPPSNGQVEVAALGGRIQQGLVYGYGNTEILIDNPAANSSCSRFRVPSYAIVDSVVDATTVTSMGMTSWWRPLVSPKTEYIQNVLK